MNTSIPVGKKISDKIVAKQIGNKFITTHTVKKSFDCVDYLLFLDQEKSKIEDFVSGVEANRDMIPKIKKTYDDLDKLREKAYKLQKKQHEQMKKERENNAKETSN